MIFAREIVFPPCSDDCTLPKVFTLSGEDVKQEGTMLLEIQALITELEDRKSQLLKDLKSYSNDHLRFQPAPDRWSMLMALQQKARVSNLD